MATTYTPNYHLGKQEDRSDKFLMQVITKNMDIIDEQLKSTDDKATAAAAGLKYKGAVNYYNDLPNDAEIGDAYTVLYAGSSGTVPDGTEYVWGELNGTAQWIDFSKDSYTKAEVDALLAAKQALINANNKLDPAYINYDSTHRAVSDTEKSTWNDKQSALTTAQLTAVNSGIDSTKVAQIATNKNNILTANAELIELVDSGAKNLCNNNLATGTISSNVTASVSADKQVTLSGSTPSNVDASFTLSTNTQFPAGTYIGSGCPSGGATDKYRIDYIVNDSTVYRDTGNGVEFTISDGDVIRSQIVVYRGNTVPSAAFAPMVCTKAAWDVSQKYVPYAPSNAELYAMIKALQA